jgi:peroxiredoxin
MVLTNSRLNRLGVFFAATLATGLFFAAAARADGHLAGTEAGQAEAMMPLPVAEDFILADTEGAKHKLSEYLDGETVVILEWFNPDCPFVKKYYGSGNNSMREAQAFAEEHGVVWLAVNSGAPGKQGHGLERNKLARTDYELSIPVLLDESGEVGRAYGATNTPQLYIIDTEGQLRFVGGVDDTVTAQDEPSVNYVIHTLEQLMAGEELTYTKTPHPGCSVKYAN